VDEHIRLIKLGILGSHQYHFFKVRKKYVTW